MTTRITPTPRLCCKRFPHEFAHGDAREERLVSIPGQAPNLLGPSEILPVRSALRLRFTTSVLPPIRRCSMCAKASNRDAGWRSRHEQSQSETLLRVDDLKMHFPIYAGVLRRQVGAVKAVDGVTFDIYRGETLGLGG